KLVILKRIAESFDKSRKYSELEINEHLKQIYDDFATIRRYLIEYKFMDRSKDGHIYWFK
ncbi:MAG TPA: transcriptional regulator, partial [Clostridiales bacterium UBA8960]|nr:transcriptional regulator [Clostridiales bacterium UBA8960]